MKYVGLTARGCVLEPKMSSYVCVRARKMKKLKMRGMKIQVAKIAARVTQKYVFFVKIVSGTSLTLIEMR